jgi:hypothetical protein
LIAVLPSATIEVLFTVVADDVMPATLDAIIGWDIIGLPHLKLVKTDDGLELYHDLLNPNKVLTRAVASLWLQKGQPIFMEGLKNLNVKVVY